jgi:hypothetical protein
MVARRILLPLLLVTTVTAQQGSIGGLRASSTAIIMDDATINTNNTPDNATTTTTTNPPPTLTQCLLSAVNVNDCGSIVSGCHWCAEPIYGLCVTETAAEKMKILPFFKCNLLDDDLKEKKEESKIKWVAVEEK